MYSILLWVLKCGKCYSNYFFQLTAGNKYNKKQFVNKHTMVLYAKSQKDLNIYTNGNAASERVHWAHLSLDEVYFDCCLRLSVLSHCSTIYWRRNYCFLDSSFFFVLLPACLCFKSWHEGIIFARQHEVLLVWLKSSCHAHKIYSNIFIYGNLYSSNCTIQWAYTAMSLFCPKISKTQWHVWIHQIFSSSAYGCTTFHDLTVTAHYGHTLAYC